MLVHAVLFDIDGTLFTGMEPIAGATDAIRFLQQEKIPYRFISNGTRKSRKTVLEKLKRLNLPVQETQIITPAGAAIQYLKNRYHISCTLLVSDDLKEDFVNAGISLTPDADVVVVGDAGDQFTYDSINLVFRQIMAGAELIALEKDRYWMDADGLSLGAGAFIKGLEFASGKSALLMGKPSPDFFREALASMGAEPETTLMIGDDINTDVGGAMACGLQGALVRTGKYNAKDLESSHVQPTHIVQSVASIPELIHMD
ncbi:MAG: TIGR01458 family HAD-type hydrolase [Methanospirillum sp.]|uniref:TIGR01458 family HAD-type hydrolase n=1 Tax=Methanospirillum sp. TaxID=45200 RepID=UPI00237014AC|nr:TIGR01458 family HAD-type hydrolase [Methanospirillum sp.]MDD1730105.1 TIGR01458 family HAD-type hydrolase [Methanospirillum sp.]